MTSDLGTDLQLIEALDEPHFDAARLLFLDYAAALGIDLRFQGFDAELADLPRMYCPPSGALLLLMRGPTPVGCGALREASPGVCEMKRLFVRDSERGARQGRRIVVSLLQRARALGYREMVLDTLADMTAARAVYRSLGFRETAPYYRNPIPDTVYMRLRLL